MTPRSIGVGTLALAVLATGCGGSDRADGSAPDGPFTVARHVETLVDESRPTEPHRGAPTRPSRTVETLVLYPATSEADDAEPADAGPFPLVVFGHGFGDSGPGFGSPLHRWASAGYVVAAPTYPQTSRDAPAGPDLAAYDQQPADVSFLIDELLRLDGERDSLLHETIDEEHIAAGGHSLGAVTTFGLAYHSCCRDERVDALVPVAGVEAPFPQGEYDYAGDAPALFIHGDADPDYDLGLEVYRRAPPPKYLLTLHGAGHRPFGRIWDETIDRAVIAFLDLYLKHRDSRARLRDATEEGVSTLRSEQPPD